jgi:hypothetical protein
MYKKRFLQKQNKAACCLVCREYFVKNTRVQKYIICAYTAKKLSTFLLEIVKFIAQKQSQRIFNLLHKFC